MKRILLSGVPGTGKSTVAQYLAESQGYYHIDMERDGFAPRNAYSKAPQTFLNELESHQNVILSWGFGPFSDASAVESLIANGFSLVWFDGNRVASFREFMKREGNDPVMESVYYGQMQMIVVTDVINRLAPTVINPFNETGAFRTTAEVAGEIMQLPNPGTI